MKTTKIITGSLAMLMSVAVMAQKPSNEQREAKREKMEAAKVGFITQELALTTQEAQVFWPVYNKYHEEKKAIYGSRDHKDKSDKKSIDDMSDKEIEALLDERIASKEKMLLIDKKYLAEYKKVLPAKKIAKLYKAENKFKRQMLEKFKQNRTNGPQGPTPPKGTKAPVTK